MNVAKLIADQMFNDGTKEKIVDGLNKSINIPIINEDTEEKILTAIYEVVEPRSAIYYFPSYEIMMDELRDYRFYNEDMIHPNQTAINYIWKKFKEVWIAEGSYQTMQQVDTIQRGLNHKPFNPNSEAHQLFLKKLQQKKETLLQAFPFINF